MARRTPEGRITESYELGDGVEEQIEELRVRSGCKDRAELIRKSLRMLDWVVQRRKEGLTVQMVREGESVVLDLT